MFKRRFLISIVLAVVIPISAWAQIDQEEARAQAIQSIVEQLIEIKIESGSFSVAQGERILAIFIALNNFNEKVAQPDCVYNQAYQENYSPDEIVDILKDAQDCYVLIDPFDSKDARDAIPSLKRKQNTVGCYMSVGTGEDWRDDFNEMKPYLATEAWDGWEGEYFISEITPKLIRLMKNRIDTFADWGCDYVEFDNMDWGQDQDNISIYDLRITENDSEKYSKDLCEYVQSKGMKCMAKSTTYGLDTFDGLTVESYNDEKDWWSTRELEGVLDKDKLGVVIHYNENKCNVINQEYLEKYGEKILFICEDSFKKSYLH